jgi:hypothetical protein
MTIALILSLCGEQCDHFNAPNSKQSQTDQILTEGIQMLKTQKQRILASAVLSVRSKICL